MTRYVTLTFLLVFQVVSLHAQTAPEEANLFTIIVFESPDDFESRTDSDRAQAYWQAFASYGMQLAEAGILRGGSALEHEGAARTVRIKNGQTVIQEALFGHQPEKVGGYFIIEVPDLETAVSWASKCPSAASGVVEVRKHIPNNQMQM